MERLTKYICDRAHGAEGVSAEKLTGAYCRGKFEATALVERLAAIEDILGDDYDLDRLRELVEADRDGRCVVLPCKIGDVIYQIVRHRNSGTVEIIQYFVNAVETEECGVTVKAHRWRPTSSVFLSQKVPNWVKVSDFGKTVFLTREAAEAALKGDQHEQNL